MSHKLAKTHIAFPVRFDKNEIAILDSDDNKIIDVRGWGRLQYLPQPIKIQESIGEYIADLMNKDNDERI